MRSKLIFLFLLIRVTIYAQTVEEEKYMPETNPLAAEKIKQWQNISLSFIVLFLLIIAFIFSHTFLSTTCFAASILLTSIFISARLGWCGAIAAASLSGMLLCFAGFSNAMIFSTYSAPLSLLLVQIFLCVNAIISLSVGIATEQIRPQSSFWHSRNDD